MRNKDFKQHLAYEAIVILGVLALLVFVCRLWPILLLVILGILIAALRLAFVSRKPIEEVLPRQDPPPEKHSEQDMHNMAFALIQQAITDRLKVTYPQARWVWKSSRAKEHIVAGDEIRILLNQAGGYREAIVHISNLRVIGLDYVTMSENTVQEDAAKEVGKEVKELNSEEVQNYEYLAFEWFDAHASDLNIRCNESIAAGCYEVLIHMDELPDQKAWESICNELKQNGIEDCVCTKDGIQINLKQ